VFPALSELEFSDKEDTKHQYTISRPSLLVLAAKRLKAEPQSAFLALLV